MLTKGIIQSIDFSSNTCIVRVPLFETAGNTYKFENEGIFSIPPGVFNGYKVGDVVIVGFDAGEEGAPIIIGKLYIGLDDERNVVGGAGQFNDLIVKNSAKLPANVEIDFNPNSEGRAINTEVALSNYNSLKDIVDAVIKNSDKINKLSNNLNDQVNLTTFTTEEQTVGLWLNNAPICQKTIIYDFVKNHKGQNGYASQSWSATISLEDLNAMIIQEDTVNGFTFITELSILPTPDIIVTQDQFTHQISGNSLTISGTKAYGYTLDKFYTTLRYIKNK